MLKVFLAIAYAAIAIVFATWAVKAFWRVRSELRRRRAQTVALRSSHAVLWRDPGPAAARDLAAGAGGRQGSPREPFHFIEEVDTGTHPCVLIRDGRGRMWRAKWGAEVHTEVFASRFAWAAGYFVETNYFVPGGRIEGCDRLGRAAACIDPAGVFRDACFELDDESLIKHFDEESWAWDDNPFVGSHELNGLKIVMMLLSNWDNKDVRDVARGSNTAIFEHPLDGNRWEARYLVIDWGGALGTWGANVLSRGRWDPAAFASQSDQFILGVDEDCVRWGYKGQRTDEAVLHITTDDARWLYRILADLTDEQIAAGVRAAGGTESEIAGFTEAIRDRLNRLRAVCDTAKSSAPA